jgi:phosphoribosyl-AMP cyclohydrolase
MDAALDNLKWDENGLIPAIAQDAESGEVLMVAWMNRESLALSIEKNQAVYWSRSRQKLWAKGEESGHVQKLKEIRIDCDADVILLQVEQKGGIACHTGRKRCFYRVYRDGEWETDEPVIKDPKQIYK